MKDKTLEELKAFARCTFKNFKKTRLSRGTADDEKVARMADEVVELFDSRVSVDKNGKLVIK